MCGQRARDTSTETLIALIYSWKAVIITTTSKQHRRQLASASGSLGAQSSFITTTTTTSTSSRVFAGVIVVIVVPLACSHAGLQLYERSSWSSCFGSLWLRLPPVSAVWWPFEPPAHFPSTPGRVGPCYYDFSHWLRYRWPGWDGRPSPLFAGGWHASRLICTAKADE